jgi:uncharacterized protein YuzE
VKVEYDAKIDAAYIYLGSSKDPRATKTYACDPEEVDGQIHLGLIGIEVLGASHKLPKATLRAGNATR